jgi:hypothetical protein
MIRYPHHRYMGSEESPLRGRGAVFSTLKSNFLGWDRLQIAKRQAEREGVC